MSADHAPFVEGGRVRIYTEDELRVRMQSAGLVPSTHPRTRCTTLLVAAVRGRADERDQARPS